MLLQIRDYVLKQSTASRQQIAREFQIDEQALQPMLDLWVRRGVLQACGSQACRSACASLCRRQTVVFYQGVD